MRRTSFGLLVGLVGLGATFAAVPRAAFADDTKNYPGSFCTPKGRAQMNEYTISQGHLDSNLSMPEDFDAVFCPITKNVSNDGRLGSVAVRITQTASNQVKCRLQRYRADVQNDTHTLPLQQTPFQTVAGTGNQTIDFSTFGPSGDMPLPTSNDWRYYHVKCVVPAGASIRSYRVTEVGNRDQLFKTYPPTMCRLNEVDSLASWTTEGSFINARDEIADDLSDKVRMVCPIVTDNVANVTGTASAHVYVGRATAGNGPISCTMLTSNDGVIVDQITPPGVGDLGTGGAQWDAELINLDLNTSPAWGRYMFQCELPGNGDAKLFGYRVREGGTVNEPLDRKVYPGTLCSSAFGLENGIFHHWNGLAVNNSGNWLETWCPIITDKDSNATGLSILRIKIKESVAGFATGGTVCDVYAHTNTGVYLTSNTGTVSGSGERSISLPLTHGAANAIYSVGCWLSVGSWINEYEVEER